MPVPPNDDASLESDPELVFVRQLAPAIDEIAARHGLSRTGRYRGTRAAMVGRVADMAPGRMKAAVRRTAEDITAVRTQLELSDGESVWATCDVAASSHRALALKHSLLLEVKDELARIDRALQLQQGRLTTPEKARGLAHLLLVNKRNSMNRATVAYLAPWAKVALHTQLSMSVASEEPTDSDARRAAIEALTAVLEKVDGAATLTARGFYRKVVRPAIADQLTWIDEQLALVEADGEEATVRLFKVERLVEMEESLPKLQAAAAEVRAEWQAALAIASSGSDRCLLLIEDPAAMSETQFDSYVNQLVDAAAGRPRGAFTTHELQ